MIRLSYYAEALRVDFSAGSFDPGPDCVCRGWSLVEPRTPICQKFELSILHDDLCAHCFHGRLCHPRADGHQG